MWIWYKTYEKNALTDAKKSTLHLIVMQHYDYDYDLNVVYKHFIFKIKLPISITSYTSIYIHIDVSREKGVHVVGF